MTRFFFKLLSMVTPIGAFSINSALNKIGGFFFFSEDLRWRRRAKEEEEEEVEEEDSSAASLSLFCANSIIFLQNSFFSSSVHSAVTALTNSHAP